MPTLNAQPADDRFAQTVPCTRCGAQVGERCTGVVPFDFGDHRERRAAQAAAGTGGGVMDEAAQDAVRVAVDALIAEDRHWGYQHRFGSGNGAAASFARAVVDALAAADADLRERFAPLALIEEYIGEGCDNASHNIREVLKGDDPRPNADSWGLDYRALTETKEK